jgi:glycosyltransferase involved in cell wall biosynthesis
MHKVSVIIPNYNHARYLRQRIQSVLDQTFQDFDLTYLDDASSDESNAIFAEFEPQQRIKAIYNDCNSGSPFKQWNKGFRATEGEYVWIAESDDVADPNFLATLVPMLDENPNVGLAYSQSCRIDRNNVVFEPTLRQWVEDLDPDRWEHDFVASGIIECQKYLVFKNTIPNASAVLIRRSVYEAIGGAEESLLLTGDWMTWIKMLLKSDIAFCARPLNSFRTHKSSVRSQTSLNGTAIYENILIRQNIGNSVSIPPQILLKIAEESISSWISLTFDPESTISLQDHIKFYQLARTTVPHPKRIVFKQLIHYIIDQSYRKIRSWVPTPVVTVLKKLPQFQGRQKI